MNSCNHPDPALCQRLKQHIHGRLWEIWQGVNIDPELADKYRRLWERKANLTKEEVVKQSGGCGCKGPVDKTPPTKVQARKSITINHGAGGLGDALLGACAVAGLKALHPQGVITYRIHPAAIPFLCLFDGYDLLVEHQSDNGTDGIKNIPENADPDDLQLNQGYNSELQSYFHKSRLARYCRNIGCENPILPRLKNRKELLDSGKYFQGAVVICPFSTWNNREYPVNSFLTLERLLLDAGYKVFLVDAADKRFANRAGQFRSPKFIDCPAEDVIGILLNAAVVIGNDSGIAHLAGILGVPTLVLTGQTKGDQIFGFYPCVRCIQGHLDCNACCWQSVNGYNGKCDAMCANLASIAPQEIFQQVQYFTINKNCVIDHKKTCSIRHLLRETFDVPGSVAELGCYRGGSALQMWNCTPSKELILFDTFAGLPYQEEGCRHDKGGFLATEDEVRELFGDRSVKIYPGVFPANLPPSDTKYSFVHVDTDLYQSTKAAIPYFWGRLNPGGVICFDDYQWPDTEGVTRAIHEFFDKKKLEVLAPHQAVVRK